MTEQCLNIHSKAKHGVSILVEPWARGGQVSDEMLLHLPFSFPEKSWRQALLWFFWSRRQREMVMVSHVTASRSRCSAGGACSSHFFPTVVHVNRFFGAKEKSSRGSEGDAMCDLQGQHSHWGKKKGTSMWVYDRKKRLSFYSDLSSVHLCLSVCLSVWVFLSMGSSSVLTDSFSWLSGRSSPQTWRSFAITHSRYEYDPQAAAAQDHTQHNSQRQCSPSPTIKMYWYLASAR